MSEEECFEKLLRIFPSHYDLVDVTTEHDLMKAINNAIFVKRKDEIKKIANDFMNHGVCHPFVVFVLQRIRYAIQFDLWRVLNGKSNQVVLQNISHKDLHELFSIIKVYPQIKLHIEVDDRGAEIIAHHLERGSPLTYLLLMGNQLTIRGISALAKSLASNTALQKLQFQQSIQMRDEDAIQFAHYLPGNRTLQILRLGTITDVGGQAILDALQQNTTLQEFGASGLSGHLRNQIRQQLEENKWIEAKKQQLRAFSDVYTPSHSVFHNPYSSQPERKSAEQELDAAQAISKRLRQYL